MYKYRLKYFITDNVEELGRKYTYAIDAGYIICNNKCYDNARYNKYIRGEEVRYGKKRDNYKSGYSECGI